MTPHTLDAALGYASRGWPVFPVRGGAKFPATRHGLKDATRDPERIKRWWTERPFHNIGVVTGPASGLMVLDIDGEPGERSLAALAQEYGPLPETLTQRTPSGGRHLLFTHVPGARSSAGALGPGLDIRSTGGYVVVAPSCLVLAGRIVRYEWLADTPLTQAPAWLIGLLDGASARSASALRASASLAATRARAKDDGPIPAGSRNQHLTSIAGRLRRRGADEGEILRLLLAENQRRCRPPLSETEVARIARSVARYVPEPRTLDEHLARAGLTQADLDRLAVSARELEGLGFEPE